jgi:NDP-sugar pyrophosphorylase family protein
VGGRPLLERTIRTLSRTGIRRVVISTHHLAERITSHFGDGHDYGIDLEYVTETLPLGTAGALRLVNQTGPLLVVNGDILTRVDFDDLVEFHREQGAELTVGMRRCELQLPYGVLDCDGPHVRAVREKPSESFWVNAGIYLVEPSIRDLIPHGERFDMTDLIDRMLADGRPVAGFPIVEYWLDIGQPADYLRAQADAEPAGVAQ